MLFMTMDRDKKEEQQRYTEQGEDHSLIRAAADGDCDAFETLVGKYERFVYRMVYCAVGNASDAEDLTQEVFLKLWRGLSGFRGQAQVLTWLSRIVRNACADHIRKKKRTVPTESLTSAADDEDTVMREPQDCDPENDPSAVTVRGEDARLLRQAMAMLPEEHRTLIILRDLEGYSYEKLSRTLGLEEGTVKSRLSRARAQLRQTLVSLGMFDDTKEI